MPKYSMSSHISGIPILAASSTSDPLQLLQQDLAALINSTADDKAAKQREEEKAQEREELCLKAE